MEQDHIAEFGRRLSTMQRTLARMHNTMIYGAVGSMMTGIVGAAFAAHVLEWPKWTVVIGILVIVGATNLFAAKTLKKDGLDEF
jgi:hypothetical protein